MPFGNESAWDFDRMTNLGFSHAESPMPFGNESAWDKQIENKYEY